MQFTNRKSRSFNNNTVSGQLPSELAQLSTLGVLILGSNRYELLVLN
jgi:hypothetical protein